MRPTVQTAATAATREGRALTTNGPAARRRGRPPRLSRERIVAAAHQILRTEGTAQLTMRRLATALHSTPTALYHHVADKDALLVSVLEHVARTLPRPDLPADPRQRVLAACTLMHGAFLADPWMVPIVARSAPVGTSAGWLTEEVVAALTELGLSDERAFWACQTLCYFTAGQALSTAPEHRSDDGPPRPDYVEAATSDQESPPLPHLTQLADRSRQLTDTYSYQLGVTHIVDGALAQGG
ncbi:TetR/AcrR family transcriptional regulator [Streptomyces sp. 796.1]|uniref:TetR/AcrR family transcriptional regulator n=1 Tax=Streptomyces sp. 796.1 TaxID=3163029 RepID=UPI0039C9F56F